MRNRGHRTDPTICQICTQKIEADQEKIVWVCGHNFKTYIHESCSPNSDWLKDFKRSQRDTKIDNIID